ncbi:hypothetical protein PSP20601_05503 [Pandoraea sputorum]|nr:hypothetical protein PSP20601_05503 [Pandoraea sputorum]
MFPRVTLRTGANAVADAVLSVASPSTASGEHLRCARHAHGPDAFAPWHAATRRRAPELQDDSPKKL